MGRASVPTPALYPAFFFVLGKAATLVSRGCGRYTRHPSPEPRTQRLTGRNRGVSGGGAITTLGAFCAVRKPCAAGCQNGVLCRFWALVGCAPKERRKPSGQRCAMRVAVPRRRGPAGLRDPIAVSLTALMGFTILLSRIVAHRKLSGCSLVTAVRFWNRCLRRSMRGTCLSEQRSGCRF